ncbi:MAG: hypothetical protein K8E66_02680, partial [Phycisphaerales bacterium]|nr:hypothetical protein [Phycisphaerales bacterium]
MSGAFVKLRSRVRVSQVDGDDPVWSHHKAWPAAVYFPDKVTGQPDLSGPADLEFTYYSDGLVRSRTDRLGREFVHHYDEQGQRIRTEIVYPDGLFPEVGGTDYTPADLADLLLYTYDEGGRLEYATAGRDLNGDGLLDTTNDAIIAENLYEYNERGSLIAEYQSYGEPVDIVDDGDGVSPAIEYGRDYQPFGLGNFDRLTSMTYPRRVQSAQQRVVALSYLGDSDHALSRVTRISDSTGAAAERAVDFAYSGSARRVGRSWTVDSGGTLAPVFAQSFKGDGVGGYGG